VSAPAIAGSSESTIVRQVRSGNDHMPSFSTALLSDAAVEELGRYVHQGLAPVEESGHMGPRALDPFVIGMVAWGALAVLACVLALLFGEGRN
jgi:hypothetical protein